MFNPFKLRVLKWMNHREILKENQKGEAEEEVFGT